jgi:hypothetical protein
MVLRWLTWANSRRLDMAGFCTKCGAPLASTSGYCTSCGAPIVAAAAPAQPVPPVIQQVAPLPVGYTVAPPAKSGGALKIVLIVVAVVVGLGILGVGTLAFIGWRAAKAITTAAGQGITVSNGNNGSTVTVPGVGSVTTGTSAGVTAQDLGVPLYPGATQDPSSSSTLAKGTTRVVQAMFWTNDPVSSVTAFYQGKLGNALSVMSLGDETIMNYGSGNNTVTMMVDSENGKTKINAIHTVTQGQ